MLSTKCYQLIAVLIVRGSLRLAVLTHCMLLLLLLHTATISNSIVIDYRKNELEEQMLMNLHRKQWTEGLVMKRFEDHQTSNEKTIEVLQHN
eukprot:15304-Heterococcus_DN1.PRE.1